jgi:hypothetical protein
MDFKLRKIELYHINEAGDIMVHVDTRKIYVKPNTPFYSVFLLVSRVLGVKKILHRNAKEELLDISESMGDFTGENVMFIVD